MKARVITTVAMASCFYIGVGAQSPPPASQSPRATESTVTLLGCVERDSSPAASTTLAFKLTNVEKGDKSAPSSAGASAATGAAATMKLDDEYKLESSASVDLSQHVSHKVEITGTMTGTGATQSGRMSGAGSRSTAPNAGSSTTTPGGGSTAGGSSSTPSDSTTVPGAMPGSRDGGSSTNSSMTAGARPGSMDTPTLRVTSLRMISASCR